MAATRHKPAKALPAPAKQGLHPFGTVELMCRSTDTQTATYLLRDRGAKMTAKDFNDALEYESMMVTRYYKQGGVPTSYRILIGDGLQYGQNVLHDEQTHSHPYYYVGKFDALLALVSPPQWCK